MGPLDSHGCGVHQTVQTSPGDDGTLMTRKKQKSSKIVALNAQNMLFFLVFLLLLFFSLLFVVIFIVISVVVIFVVVVIVVVVVVVVLVVVLQLTRCRKRGCARCNNSSTD